MSIEFKTKSGQQYKITLSIEKMVNKDAAINMKIHDNNIDSIFIVMV